MRVSRSQKVAAVAEPTVEVTVEAPALTLPPVASAVVPQTLALPSWCPPLDLKALAARTEAWLVKEGAPLPHAAETSELILTDADHTYLKTHAPIFVRHATSGELLQDPKTGEPVMLGLLHPDYENEFKEYKAAREDVDWNAYGLDFRLFQNGAVVREQRPIGNMLEKLKQQSDTSRLYVITARSSGDVRTPLREKLTNNGVLCEAVFPVNVAEVYDGIALGVSGTAPRKALVMAGLIAAYAEKSGGSPPAKVKYYEDSDENLRKAMQLLPRLFPTVRFEFYDVVHEGEAKFRQKLVARSSKNGTLMRPHGKPMSAADVEAYVSKDKPHDTGPRSALLRYAQLLTQARK